MTKKTLEEYGAPYPEPSSDRRRFVIFLDEKKDEQMYKLQLLPGRVLDVEGEGENAGKYIMNGSLTEKTVEGWGFPYYVVDVDAPQQKSPAKGGRNRQREQHFVSVKQKLFVRYNSKLPVVVYVPKDAELRYRFWTPSKTTRDLVEAT